MNRRSFLYFAGAGPVALLSRVSVAAPLKFNEIYSLKCLGNVNGPRYLDGRTANGTVGLVAKLVKPFSGTKWQLVNAGNGVVAFRWRGDVEGTEMARRKNQRRLRRFGSEHDGPIYGHPVADCRSGQRADAQVPGGGRGPAVVGWQNGYRHRGIGEDDRPSLHGDEVGTRALSSLH
jgi:hypothetical protein